MRDELTPFKQMFVDRYGIKQHADPFEALKDAFTFFSAHPEAWTKGSFYYYGGDGVCACCVLGYIKLSCRDEDAVDTFMHKVGQEHDWLTSINDNSANVVDFLAKLSRLIAAISKRRATDFKGEDKR